MLICVGVWSKGRLVKDERWYVVMRGVVQGCGLVEQELSCVEVDMSTHGRV